MSAFEIIDTDPLFDDCPSCMRGLIGDQWCPACDGSGERWADRSRLFTLAHNLSVAGMFARIGVLEVELAATRRMADAASLELSNARVAHQEEIGLAAEVELRLVEAREADAAEAAAVYEAMRAEVDALRCGDLDAYRDGELSEERRAAFEAHLVGCKACEAGLLDWMQIEGVASAPARKP